MLKYCSIGSGSSGNCHFVSYKDTNILIDAGLSGKRIITGLEEINADIEKIKGRMGKVKAQSHVGDILCAEGEYLFALMPQEDKKRK